MSFIGNQPISAAFLTDTFNGNGTTTAFTLSAAPAGSSSILVAISGVVQAPATYGVVGTTLNFSAAPPVGTASISVRYLGIPASGVTTTAYRTLTEFTATASQTTFTPPSYTVGFIAVYQNGVMLGSTDYTATNGTTVVLAVGALVSDLVTTESFYVSSVLNALPVTGGTISGNLVVTGTASITGVTTLTGGLNTPLAVTSGGTGVTTSTGSGANVLGTSPSISGAVMSTMASSVITSATSQASTSGTSIDFTGIPSWVKRITVMFNGVSTNGTSVIQAQLGSGSVTTTGYNSQSWGYSTWSGVATSGLYLNAVTVAIYPFSGTAVLTLFGSNTWVINSNIGFTNVTSYGWTSTGTSPALSGALDRVRITTVNGTDTFDAGSINILYE